MWWKLSSPPLPGALEALIVGNDNQSAGMRFLADQLLDQVIGLVIVHRKEDMNAIAVFLLRVPAAATSLGRVEDDGGQGRAILDGAADQVQQTRACPLQLLRFHLAGH